MKSKIDLTTLTRAEEITAADEPEAAALRDMLLRAERYLGGFSWCPAITERYLAFGVGGVIAICLFRLEGPVNGTDEWLWVIEGDLPSAYFVTDRAHDACSALGVYCEMMEEWADAVTAQRPLDDVFPINAPPTAQNAEKLRNRIKFIREGLLPEI